MATYDLEEQEQIDELKTWWKLHGTLVTAAVLAVCTAFAGWQGWNWWQTKQSVEASVLYFGLQQAAAQRDAKRVRDIAGELIDKYGSTAYASMGAMYSAKLQSEAGDVKTARAQLAWAVENANDDVVRDLARLRLAAVLVDEKAYDEALKLLAVDPALSFAPRFAEQKGDVLLAQGKAAEAKTAYELALSRLDAVMKASPNEAGVHRPYRDMLQTKLDAVGSAK